MWLYAQISQIDRSLDSTANYARSNTKKAGKVIERYSSENCESSNREKVEKVEV